MSKTARRMRPASPPISCQRWMLPAAALIAWARRPSLRASPPLRAPFPGPLWRRLHRPGRAPPSPSAQHPAGRATICERGQLHRPERGRVPARRQDGRHDRGPAQCRARTARRSSAACSVPAASSPSTRATRARTASAAGSAAPGIRPREQRVTPGRVRGSTGPATAAPAWSAERPRRSALYTSVTSMPPSEAVASVQPMASLPRPLVREQLRQPGHRRHHLDAHADERRAAEQHQLPQLGAERGGDGRERVQRGCSPTMTVLRPNRSISQPPSRPNTPPHRAAIQSMRPTHRRTTSGCAGRHAEQFRDGVGPPITGNISSS